MNYRVMHESLLRLMCMCVLHVNDIVEILPVSKKACMTYAHSISSLLFSCSILIFRSGMDKSGIVGSTFMNLKRPGQSLQYLIMVSKNAILTNVK